MIIETVEAAEKRNVLVAVRFDGRAKELIHWALLRVANPGDRVVVVHVCRNCDSISKVKPSLEGHLANYEGLCNKIQVELTAEILKGCSIKKVLVREAKNLAAEAVIVGTSKHGAIGGWLSLAKYCAKRLLPPTEIIAINHGKVVFRSISNSRFVGFTGDPKPRLDVNESCTSIENQSDFGDSEIPEIARLSHEVTQSFEDENRDASGNAEGRGSLRSISLPIEDFTMQRPGWPLLQSASSIAQPAVEARKMSVVQWVMHLPNRSLLETPESKSNSFSSGNASESEKENSKDQDGNDNRFMLTELHKHFTRKLEMYSPECKRFSFDTLRTSTSQFSPENLIGRGGCSRVFRGTLAEGNPIAVKTMKSSKETWHNFVQEIDIMITLKHEHITPLHGICIQNNELISIYDLYSKGNLEENLHGDNIKNTIFSWEVRFKIAVGISEALNYLHNECSPPIIHRDVKSSNILLTEEFEPQLSDFGLAIWGPTTASFMTHSNVVGTFGYLAPEYFMYGKVSDKIDVYAFGVVLLELLSSRKPIGYHSSKDQESLVMWAKPKLEIGDFERLVDPKLGKDIDKDQMQRMCFAAKCCLTQSARLRPKMNQIVRVLKGDELLNEEIRSQLENQDYNDDEVYPDMSAESHVALALDDVSDNSTSFNSLEQSSLLSVEEYLKSRWIKSSTSDD